MWNVYSADRHLVATYSTEEAAAAHVAAWPALYYSFAAPAHVPPPADSMSVSGHTGHSSRREK